MKGPSGQPVLFIFTYSILHWCIGQIYDQFGQEVNVRITDHNTG